MKNSITILVLFLTFSGNTQVLFEIVTPSNLRGVYPCMEPTHSAWGSPDLSSVGNWFSDTVGIANDGVAASACDSLVSSHQGNFAIFRREHCSISEQLLRVQNAGATGAFVIDTVVGRPLTFGFDSISNQINIPFVVISKDEGDNIISSINSGEAVVVNMGNKEGQNAVDVGIYMDRTLWSSFAYYPNTGKIFPDISFGTWIYNRGQQDVQNLEVEFWVSNSNFSDSIVSNSFDLLSGDSTYIPFTSQFSWPNYWEQSANYGYRILNLGSDEDTCAVLITNYDLTTPYNIAFTTDMYHDERRRQEPFHEIYMSEGGSVVTGFDPKLTQLIYIVASTNPSNCGWGIDEISSEVFTIYPNPAQSTFEITSEVEFSKVKMISMSGKEIELNLSPQTNLYDFDASSGVYAIEITAHDGNKYIKQLFVTD